MSLRTVIGIHSCREALKVRTSKELKKIYLKANWSKHPALVELAELAKAKKMKPEVLSLKKMNQIGESHQGACVLVSHQLNFDISSIGPDSVVLILDRVQDPRNFGAIIRTAWLMSVDCIFISSRHSVSLSPSVIKAASGGVEHIPIEPRDNLHQCLKGLKKNQFWLYAMDSHSKKSLWDEKFEGRIAFLLGGESFGLRKGLKALCDELLSIPQKEKSASYNVSIAAGIALGECFRQRGVNV